MGVKTKIITVTRSQRSIATMRREEYVGREPSLKRRGKADVGGSTVSTCDEPAELKREPLMGRNGKENVCFQSLGTVCHCEK